MKVKALVAILLTLDQEKPVYAAITEEGGEVRVEPVTESCEDDAVIGYMITDLIDEAETTH